MAVSLIPELEDVIRYGTRAKRVDALQRITALFLDGAKSYSDAHVDVFDDVFGLLIEEIETKARAELSRHLAPVGNAPVKVLRTLANDDDIAVAGPVLKYAPRLGETDLVGVATTKSQAHLQAISTRPALGVAVTDVLVRRGDREVVRCVADNRGARISQNGFVSLVRRAEDDGILAEKVGLRPDIPRADVPRIADQGDRGGARSSACRGDSRRQGGDLPRAGESLQGGRRARRSARLQCRAARGAQSRSRRPG